MKSFGFTRYESLAYLTLWTNGAMSAGELAKSSGIPYNRCYDVLASLYERGFVEENAGTKKIFSAVNPEIAFYRHSKAIEDLKNEVKKLSRKKTGRGSIERLRSKEEFANAFKDLVDRAKYEITIVAPSAYISDFKSKTGVTTSVYTEKEMEMECDFARKISPTSNIIVLRDVDELLVFPEISLRANSVAKGFLSSFPEVIFSYYVYIRELFYSSTIFKYNMEKRMSFAVLYHFLDAVKRSKKKRAKVLIDGVWIEGEIENIVLEEAINRFSLKKSGGRIVVGGPFSVMEEKEAEAEILL